jgi:hypothetical protein
VSGESAGRRLRAAPFFRGFDTAVSGNAQAFGFSITITSTYGVLSAAEGNPSTAEIFGFALSAVAAFSLLNLVVVGLFLRDEPGEPSRVVLAATATDFVAVGSGIATAVGVRYWLTDWPAWVVTPFVATLSYVVMQALEIAVGFRKARANDERRSHAEPQG